MKITQNDIFINKYNHSPKQNIKSPSNQTFDKFCCLQNSDVSKQVSFKGLPEFMVRFSLTNIKNSFFGDNKSISKEQAVNKLREKKISDISGFLMYCLKDENSYFENRVDAIVELFEKTKSQSLTPRMFRVCFSDGFNKKVYSDMIDCLDKNIKPEIVHSVFKTATNYGKSKYNPAVVKYALNNKQGCNSENFQRFLACSINKKTGKFSSNHFEMLKRISKTHGFTLWNIANTPLLGSFNNEKATQELAKQIGILSGYGLTENDISKILYNCGPDVDWIKSLTKDIPQNLIQDKEKLLYFFESRTNESKTFSSNCVYRFNKEKFDYFNQVYNELIKNGRDINYHDLENNVKKATENIDLCKKNKKKFTLNAIKYMDLDKINNVNDSLQLTNSDKLMDLLAFLDEKDRPSVDKVWEYVKYKDSSYGKILLENFEKYYPLYKEKASAHKLIRLLDLCWKAPNEFELFEESVKYVLENIQKSEEQLNLELQYVTKHGTDTQKIENINKLLNAGFTLQELNLDHIYARGLWSPRMKTGSKEEQNKLLENIIKLESAMIFFSLLFMDIDLDDYETQRDYAEFLNSNYVKGTILHNLTYVNKILPHLNPKTDEEKDERDKVLTTLIGDLYKVELSNETLKKLNLNQSRYLSKIFNPDSDFIDAFSDFTELIEKNKKKPLLDIFNNLPQNRKTQELFRKYNLNYNRWITANPSTNIVLNIKYDTQKDKQNVLKNLESDFNDELMNDIPKTEREKLFKAVENAGYELKETEVSSYDTTGTLLNNKKKGVKLYKNSKPIEFEDVHRILTVVKNQMNKNDFWNIEDGNETVDTAKETLKNHFLKMRYQEMKKADNKHGMYQKTIQIQKADMNDIAHSLFLGNDAGCCTAIGTGCNSWSAPAYIKNKMVSCIEVKDDEKYVGNTMIYIALIDDKPSILIDNIELKPGYQFNDEIRDGIIDCAIKIAKEIGNPQMPIYAGPNRHKVNMDKFPLNDTTFSLVGDTEGEDVYLDFNSYVTPVSFDKVYQCCLHKIR